MSKFLSMEALSSVSSWWVPVSISSLAASSGVRGASAGVEDFVVGLEVKPRLWGGRERRTCSTESRARSARTLTVLIMSSRRDLAVSLRNGWVWKMETYDWRVAKVLC